MNAGAQCPLAFCGRPPRAPSSLAPLQARARAQSRRALGAAIAALAGVPANLLDEVEALRAKSLALRGAVRDLRRRVAHTVRHAARRRRSRRPSAPLRRRRRAIRT